MSENINETIEDVKAFLKNQKALGNDTLPKGSTKRTKKNQLPLEDIRKELGDCKRCKLCKTRTNIVFGVGDPKAEIMFVGEAPGADEDAKGEPFVGRAGQLLTKIIVGMGLQRSEVYIANIAKCRPPENRNPEEDEVAACSPFILKQISVIKPKVVVFLGAVAVKSLLKTEVPISKLRGKFMDWSPEGYPEIKVKLMPTYHPAYILRNPAMKRPVWEDMQAVMKEIGKPIA